MLSLSFNIESLLIVICDNSNARKMKSLCTIEIRVFLCNIFVTGWMCQLKWNYIHLPRKKSFFKSTHVACINQVEDISMLPTLSNLSVLRVNNNKLRSLDGIQALSHLKELYCQRNMIVSCWILLTCSASDFNSHNFIKNRDILMLKKKSCR